MAVNDLIWKGGSRQTLQNGDGASVTNGSYQQATTKNILASDWAGYGWIGFEGIFTYASAPAVGSVIDVYLRPINWDGTPDAETPQADFQNRHVASIELNDVTSAQNIKLPAVAHPLPLVDCEVYLANRAGQTLSANWTLKAVPMTLAPSAA